MDVQVHFVIINSIFFYEVMHTHHENQHTVCRGAGARKMDNI